MRMPMGAGGEREGGADGHCPRASDGRGGGDGGVPHVHAVHGAAARADHLHAVRRCRSSFRRQEFIHRLNSQTWHPLQRCRSNFVYLGTGAATRSARTASSPRSAAAASTSSPSAPSATARRARWSRWARSPHSPLSSSSRGRRSRACRRAWAKRQRRRPCKERGVELVWRSWWTRIRSEKLTQSRYVYTSVCCNSKTLSIVTLW